MRLAPSNDVAATVPYTVCTSNDREGYLLAAVDTANRIKALKADPRQVVVASIQGPMTPYVVSWRAPVTADTSCGAASCPWPRISLSCMASDGSFGEPGLRTAELVAEFGAQGLVLPICADSFAPSLQRIGELTRTLWSPPCIEHEVRRDPERLQPECKVSVQMVQNGTVTGNAIPSCADTGNAAPCWTLTRGSQCPGSEVSVTADPTAPWPDNATLTVSCALCDPGVPDPVHGCP
jgi:hypothetical protein